MKRTIRTVTRPTDPREARIYELVADAIGMLCADRPTKATLAASELLGRVQDELRVVEVRVVEVPGA